jgi:hypothetical protein
MPHEFSHIPIADAVDDSRQAQNPYASPLAEGPFLAKDEREPIGIWRFKDRVIAHPSIPLPPRCIRTNLACDESEKRNYRLNSNTVRRIAMLITFMFTIIGVMLLFSGAQNNVNLSRRFVPGGLLIALGLLLTAFIYCRGSFEVLVPYYLSLSARRTRIRWRAVGIFIMLGATVLLTISATGMLDGSTEDTAVGVGVLTLIVGGVICFSTILPLRIEPAGGSYYVIHGCGKPFRDSFPETQAEKSVLGRFIDQFSLSR